MRAVIRFLRVAVRDGFPDTWARVTAASTLGAMGLSLANVEAPDTVHFLMAWWGTGAGIYGAILWAAAPADPDACPPLSSPPRP